ncbi:MAG TPA: hypothetical protein VME92_05445 [Acetobacteraceae bacterium]|nr:hypothetical protein [Acetobacteraceae bacterium]
MLEDVAEVQTAEGKVFLFVFIGRTSKFALGEPNAKATTRAAADLLRAVSNAVPYKIQAMLTGNGIRFASPRAKPALQPKSAK